MKMIKKQIFDEKQLKMPRKYMYINIKQHSYLYCELAPLICDVTCLKLCRYRENTGDKKLPGEHTSLLVVVYLYT